MVLRGEGPVFSAGVDLGELAASTGQPGHLRPFRKVFLDCANLCEEMAKPVVCQIHRTCCRRRARGGAGLRPADRRQRRPVRPARGASFGIIPDVGGSTRLPAVVGLGRAKELIMTARMIGAEEAERIGLVNRVVAPEELETATQALVEELLANSHVAVGRAKRVIDASARPALAQTLEMEVAVQEYCVAAAIQSGRPGRRGTGRAGRLDDRFRGDVPFCGGADGRATQRTQLEGPAGGRVGGRGRRPAKTRGAIRRRMGAESVA